MLPISFKNSQKILQGKTTTSPYGITGELSYDAVNWTGWTLDSGVTGSQLGLKFTANGVNFKRGSRVTALKVSTNYGILLQVAEVVGTITKALWIDANTVCFTATKTIPTTVGYKKFTATTKSSITTNFFEMWYDAADTSGNSITIKDIRIFELPVGSQIATDFATLTADQLNVIYTYRSGSLFDLSRNLNHGTFSNVTWYQLSSGIWMMNFNGTTSYVEMADNPKLRLTEGGTIAVWVCAKSIGETNGAIIFKGTNTAALNGYRIILGNNNAFIFSVNAGTNTVSLPNAILYNAYTLIAVTVSSTGRKLYSNTIDVTDTGGNETALPPNVAGVVTIGNRPTTQDRTFDGYISPLKIWNYALSQTEITDLFTRERFLYGI
jgi:hypothetical protein